MKIDFWKHEAGIQSLFSLLNRSHLSQWIHYTDIRAAFHCGFHGYGSTYGSTLPSCPVVHFDEAKTTRPNDNGCIILLSDLLHQVTLVPFGLHINFSLSSLWEICWNWIAVLLKFKGCLGELGKFIIVSFLKYTI